MNGENLLSSVIPVVLGAGFVAVVIFLTVARADTILNGWASRNGYRVLNRDYAWFFKGPFFWSTTRSQVVFRVTVQDGSGVPRSGWVRCGSWWGGILSDDAEVRWDD